MFTILGAIAGFLFLIVLVLGLPIMVFYGVYVALRDGIEHAEVAERDSRRKRVTYQALLASFEGSGVPKRVVRELYGILWREVLWAVKLNVTCSTPIEAVYSPRWVDVGSGDSLQRQLARRCGVEFLPSDSEGLRHSTLGELSESVAAAMFSGPSAAHSVMLVRPAIAPNGSQLLRPTSDQGNASPELLLRAPAQPDGTAGS